MKITAALFIFSILLSCSNRQDNGNTISETEEIDATSTIVSQDFDFSHFRELTFEEATADWVANHLHRTTGHYGISS